MLKDWLPIGVSVLSFIVAAFALYRAYLRGPRITVAFLQAPSHWQIQGYEWDRNTSTGGGFYSPSPYDPKPVPEYLRIEISGPCGAYAVNSGPRAGASWSWVFAVDGVPPPWSGGLSARDLPLPLALAGHQGLPVIVTVHLWLHPWESDADFQSAKRALGTAPPIAIAIHHTAHSGWFGRKRQMQTNLRIDPKDVYQALHDWLNPKPIGPPPAPPNSSLEDIRADFDEAKKALQRAAEDQGSSATPK
jgi:hypothetical protein